MKTPVEATCEFFRNFSKCMLQELSTHELKTQRLKYVIPN